MGSVLPEVGARWGHRPAEAVMPNRVTCVWLIMCLPQDRDGSAGMTAQAQTHGCVCFTFLLSSKSVHARLQLVPSAACQTHSSCFPFPLPLISTLSLTPQVETSHLIKFKAFL